MSHVGVSGSTGVSRLWESTRQFRALSGLSDREILSRVKDLVSRERAVTLDILVHLMEVERRRLHLGLGYPSMFDYCTKHLRYSSSAASRRIQAARCIRDYPEVYGLLERNELNLSTVSLVAPILTKENKDDLLRRIRNKSQKEAEAIVADYRPPVALRDRARPVCVAAAEPRVNGAPGLPLSRAASSQSPTGHLGLSGLAGSDGTSGMPATQRTPGSSYSRSGSEKRPNAAADGVGGLPRFERKFQVQFLASERFMKKFERTRALLSNRSGALSYEAVLEAALDEFLKNHDPENRKQRREARKEKAAVKSEPANDGHRGATGRRDASRADRPCRGLDPSSHIPTAARCERSEPSRHIPAATRDAVYARDKGRCTYVGSTGKRCDATHHLQIDHIVPYARGGTNGVHNLRLLCERHNKHEAERVLGASAHSPHALDRL